MVKYPEWLANVVPVPKKDKIIIANFHEHFENEYEKNKKELSGYLVNQSNNLI